MMDTDEIMLQLELDGLREQVASLEDELRVMRNRLQVADLELHKRDRLIEKARKRSLKMFRDLS